MEKRKAPEKKPTMTLPNVTNIDDIGQSGFSFSLDNVAIMRIALATTAKTVMSTSANNPTGFGSNAFEWAAFDHFGTANTVAPKYPIGQSTLFGGASTGFRQSTLGCSSFKEQTLAFGSTGTGVFSPLSQRCASAATFGSRESDFRSFANVANTFCTPSTQQNSLFETRGSSDNGLYFVSGFFKCIEGKHIQRMGVPPAKDVSFPRWPRSPHSSLDSASLELPNSWSTFSYSSSE